MVGSAVAVKKLWKSLRTSVTATGRVVKQKLTKNKKKKRFSSPPRSKERYDHYNYSDDEESDNQLKKKLRSWKIKAMACVVGKAEIEPPTRPFVYVTDLYSSTSSSAVACGGQDVKDEAEKIKEVEKEKGGATGSSSPADSGDSRFPNSEKAPPSPSKIKKTVGWSVVAESEKGVGKRMAEFVKEVDTEADLFIAKFHDEMRLQRQKSVAEYHEMINRGASSAAL